MLCSQYGNPLSYYGNIQCGFYNLPIYTWGAWESPYPKHYPKPAEKKEEQLIEERQKQIVNPTIEIKEPNENIILRMQGQMVMREQSIPIPIFKPVKVNKSKPIDTDDEDLFILM